MNPVSSLETSTSTSAPTSTPPRPAEPEIPELACAGLDCGVGGQVILRGVDLVIPPGSRTAVVGINGAGKSTLLRALAGLTAPHAGRVTIGGEDLAGRSAATRARTIAFVGQEDTPPMELRVGELVALGRVPHHPPWRAGGGSERSIVIEALERVGMADYIDRRCHQLSGGERRRVVLARGLAQGTPILALDEPANHLDIAWQLRLLALLGEYRGTVVASMHDLDLVLRHFDQVAVVGDGRLLAAGPPVETLNPALLRTAFGVDAAPVTDPGTGRPHLLIRAVSGEPGAAQAQQPEKGAS